MDNGLYGPIRECMHSLYILIGRVWILLNKNSKQCNVFFCGFGYWTSFLGFIFNVQFFILEALARFENCWIGYSFVSTKRYKVLMDGSRFLSLRSSHLNVKPKMLFCIFWNFKFLIFRKQLLTLRVCNRSQDLLAIIIEELLLYVYRDLGRASRSCSILIKWPITRTYGVT